MVDALREVRQVVVPNGTLIDVRPVVAPMTIEVVIGNRPCWAMEINMYVGLEDEEAADAAVRHARSHEWFAFEKRQPFDFEIYCDTAEDLKAYAQMHRRTREAGIPYEDLEARRLELSKEAAARLRCRRTWTLSTYIPLARRSGASP